MPGDAGNEHLRKLAPDQALWVGRDALQNRTPQCPLCLTPMRVKLNIGGELRMVSAVCPECGAALRTDVRALRPEPRAWTEDDFAAFFGSMANGGTPCCPLDGGELWISRAQAPGGGLRVMFHCPICNNMATAAQPPQ
jgi:transcription elongation factor Elf1